MNITLALWDKDIHITTMNPLLIQKSQSQACNLPLSKSQKWRWTSGCYSSKRQAYFSSIYTLTMWWYGQRLCWDICRNRVFNHFDALKKSTQASGFNFKQIYLSKRYHFFPHHIAKLCEKFAYEKYSNQVLLLMLEHSSFNHFYCVS